MGQPPLPPYQQPPVPPYQQPPAAYQGGWPGRPGYPQPRPQPVTRRKRGRGKTLAIVLSIVGGLGLLCGGTGVLGYLTFFHTSGDPEQVVVDYHAAVERRDCEQVVDLVTKRSWQLMFGASTRSQAVPGCQEFYETFPIGSGRLEATRLVSQNRTTALVEVTVTDSELALGDGPITQIYTLHREERAWRLALLAF